MDEKKIVENKNKTFVKEQLNHLELKWYIIDAKQQNLGRLSSKIAYILKGKNNPKYCPSQESNIKIIIINSKDINITGKKNKQKIYVTHSGRPGGLKKETFHKLQDRIPNRIIEHAIKGMLPKNSLGRKLFQKLKIYSDHQHPHEAQKPIRLEIK